MREYMYGYVKLLRFLLCVMACFLCIGLLLSIALESGSLSAPPPPLSPAKLEGSPAMSRERYTGDGRIVMELFHVSKRRVPNGPVYASIVGFIGEFEALMKYLYSRRAGNSGRSPRGA